jgi:hypothetical protein
MYDPQVLTFTTRTHSFHSFYINNYIVEKGRKEAQKGD